MTRPLFLARLAGTQAEMGAQHGRLVADDAGRLLDVLPHDARAHARRRHAAAPARLAARAARGRVAGAARPRAAAGARGPLARVRRGGGGGRARSRCARGDADVRDDGLAAELRGARRAGPARAVRAPARRARRGGRGAGVLDADRVGPRHRGRRAPVRAQLRLPGRRRVGRGAGVRRVRARRRPALRLLRDARRRHAGGHRRQRGGARDRAAHALAPRRDVGRRDDRRSRPRHRAPRRDARRRDRDRARAAGVVELGARDRQRAREVAPCVLELAGRAVEVVRPAAGASCLVCTNRYRVARAAGRRARRLARRGRSTRTAASSGCARSSSGARRRSAARTSRASSAIGAIRDAPARVRRFGAILAQPLNVHCRRGRAGAAPRAPVGVDRAPVCEGAWAELAWTWDGPAGGWELGATERLGLHRRAPRGVRRAARRGDACTCATPCARTRDRTTCPRRARRSSARSQLAPDDPSLRLAAAWLALEADAHEPAIDHVRAGLQLETEPYRRGQLLLWGARAAGAAGPGPRAALARRAGAARGRRRRRAACGRRPPPARRAPAREPHDGRRVLNGPRRRGRARSRRDRARSCCSEPRARVTLQGCALSRALGELSWITSCRS